jgi:hypothetical protein
MNCKNACGKAACSWATDFTPVEGWIAEPTILSEKYSYSQPSFCVLWCPQYERGHSEVEYEDNDIRNLVFEIILQAVEDWKALDFGKISERRYRSELIKASDLISFFNSKYFAYLCKITLDNKPDEIMAALHVPERSDVEWS